MHPDPSLAPPVERIPTARHLHAVEVVLGSKAETLERLAPILRHAVVLPLVHFPVARWRAGRDEVVAEVLARPWSRQPLIVRSSTLHEDDPETMLPGGYLSVPDVEGRTALEHAVDAVIASYGVDGDGGAGHQVLVQPMIRDATTTGVAFSCDPNSAAPYLVVNYEEHGDPAAVTSGRASQPKTYYWWKPNRHQPEDPRMRRVLALVREIEEKVGSGALDVEFAFDAADRLHLLQARRLPVTAPAGVAEQSAALAAIAGKVEAASRRHPYLLGRRSVFGVMPDWNPAEIIGMRPRPLALSIYRRLITDAEWAHQRARYGYRDLRGFPLLLDFFGLPFVDVRASCNSLVPADLDRAIAERLLSSCLDLLVARPELHDKVEFEVFFSCYSFTVGRRLAAQTSGLLSPAERDRILDSLRRLTNRLLSADDGVRREDAAGIASLRTRFLDICDSDLTLPAKIYWLLEDCRRFGTLPFAGYARLGFIATEMLRSLVQCGTITDGDVARLMTSLDTATNRMLRDRWTLRRDDFLARYGFLRPGTYDIRSPRYDETPDVYFDWRQQPESPAATERFTLPARTMREISGMLRAHGLEQDADGLLAFIRTSIEQREDSKFEFTRHLSEALRLITELGRQAGFGPDELSYATVDAVDELYRGAEDTGDVLARSVSAGKRSYELTRRIVLPPVITRPEDVTSFHLPPAEPNFVTQRTATGPVRVVSADPADLSGKILLLPSGDPGYDWIFSKGIAGFVTQHGGVNSHMAIRAHQLGIPAVVGAGEVLYDRWSAARCLSLDCLNRRVEVLR
jgi:phosphohistidine swiveling domain-containing protein